MVGSLGQLHVGELAAKLVELELASRVIAARSEVARSLGQLREERQLRESLLAGVGTRKAIACVDSLVARPLTSDPLHVMMSRRRRWADAGGGVGSPQHNN